MSDTFRFNERLIELIRCNPALYNWNSPDYKNEEVKQNSWKNISEELGVDVEVCRRRWRSFRTRYRRELTKIEKGFYAGGRKRQWIFFTQLNFLYDFLRAREMLPTLEMDPNLSSDDDQDLSLVVSPSNKRASNGVTVKSECDEPTDCPEVVPIDSEIYESNTKKQRIDLPSFSLASLDHSNSFNIEESLNHVNSGYPPSTGATVPLYDILDLSKSILKEIQKKVVDSNTETDEAGQFGRLVAAILRKLKHPSAVKIQIMKMLYEEEMSQREEASSFAST